MTPIFNRHGGSHPLGNALDELQKSRDPRRTAVAVNLRYDHRVSLKRDEAFSAFCDHPITGNELWNSLGSYHKERIRALHDPDFVNFDLNQENILAGHYCLEPQLLHKDSRLAGVFDLNGLLTVFLWASGNRTRKTSWLYVFKDFPSSYPDFEKWLDGKLSVKPAEQEKFIELTFDVLNSYRHEVSSYQPSWVTGWDAFEPRIIPDDASGWTKALGVNKAENRWLIVLKYTVAEAGTLARPTQLDAGDYEWHFPSPLSTPLQEGGHPMELHPPPPDPLPEYVHQQLRDYDIKHWHDAGSLIAKTKDTHCAAAELYRLRQEHHGLLCAHYRKSDITAWMPNPM